MTDEEMFYILAHGTYEEAMQLPFLESHRVLARKIVDIEYELLHGDKYANH